MEANDLLQLSLAQPSGASPGGRRGLAPLPPPKKKRRREGEEGEREGNKGKGGERK